MFSRDDMIKRYDRNGCIFDINQARERVDTGWLRVRFLQDPSLLGMVNLGEQNGVNSACFLIPIP